MTEKTPAAFMSYVHTDDKQKQLTTLCERMSDEVQVQTGIEFPIFQDRKGIKWGENWRQRIENSLDETTFLIPIITPGFFNSKECRAELKRFIEREKKLCRNDLILSVYFVDTPLLNETGLSAADELAEVIASRQYADWRDLRFEPFTNPLVGKTLAQLAVHIRNALARVQTVKNSPATTTDRSRRPAATGGGQQSAPSPTPKKERPICIVDSMHHGDFSTITEAIKSVEPETRILIRRGIYEEGLVIDKALEIIGDGLPGDVVIKASDRDVILFQTWMGRLVNLTLRQISGNKSFCVDIGQGRLELEDCDISSRSLTCVAIYGDADPTLRRNRIHNGKEGGVLVYHGGRGTLEDNDIFGNMRAGVQIESNGNPTLRRNRIHHQQWGGVYVCEDGKGTLEDNEIFSNALSGVEIKNNSNPTLRRNRIYDSNRGCGLLVLDSGQGILEDNEIFGNSISEVVIKTAGNPTLRRNHIHHSKQAGVYVYHGGQGTLEDNDIFSNAYSGIISRSAGNPIVRNNRINKNGKQGVWVYENGGGTFENNDLTENAKGAWSITEDCAAKVTRGNNQE